MTDATFLPLASPDRLWGYRASSVQELQGNERRVADDLLRLFIANRVPLTLWGPVGARKTRTIEALARESDENGTPYQVVTVQPSTVDPTVLSGMFYTSREEDRTVMRRSVPRVAEEIVKYAKMMDGLTILFADEMTTCMPSQQNAMLGLLTHGRFDEIDISEHIAIVMAANPEGTVSTMIPLSEAVMNRGGHIAWFGDPGLFLEDWSGGFKGATKPPQPSTVALVEKMFRVAPDAVFRSADDRWSPDSLVPWNMLEHTERSVTEFARMTELVQEVFDGRDEQIVNHYVAAVAKAMLGPKWSEITMAALDQQIDSVSPKSVIEWVRKVGPRNLRGAATISDVVGEQYGNPWPIGVRHDQAVEIMDRLVEGSYRDDVFSEDNFLGAWILACTAPNEAALAALSEPLADLTNLAMRADKDKAIPNGERPIPTFVTNEVKTVAVAAVKAQRDAQKAQEAV